MVLQMMMMSMVMPLEILRGAFKRPATKARDATMMALLAIILLHVFFCDYCHDAVMALVMQLTISLRHPFRSPCWSSITALLLIVTL